MKNYRDRSGRCIVCGGRYDIFKHDGCIAHISYPGTYCRRCKNKILKEIEEMAANFSRWVEDEWEQDRVLPR